MANLLFLVHRLPYPPDKGDKVRSFHLLEYLAARHRVFLGTFVDDAADEVHVDAVRPFCAGLSVARLHPRRARVASLDGLFRGEALTLRYFRDAELQQWVDRTLQRESIGAAVVFSSSMAQYLEHHPGVPTLIDLVDVDSAKWTEYARAHRWPLSWLYQREGSHLLAYERAVAVRARRAFLVTEREAALFARLAPECAQVVEPLGNGVDAAVFAPDPARQSPFGVGENALVFTGAMDYWPNVDAVRWFTSEALPSLRARWPRLRFYIVGRNPTAAVRALAADGICVTGAVPDVRPYLQHASAVVAPLRIARGIQNKVLEAMAMARPVVAARACVEAITAEAGVELIAAEHANDYVREIDELLRRPAHGNAIGSAARQRVVESYSWEARLSGLDRHLAQIEAEASLQAA